MKSKDKHNKRIKRYKDKLDVCMVYLPRGAAAAVRGAGESVSGLCGRLLAEWAYNNNIVDYPNIQAAAAPSTGVELEREILTYIDITAHPERVGLEREQGANVSEQGKNASRVDDLNGARSD